VATAIPPVTALVRPRAILFDWDNTLVDSWPTIHDALNTTLAAFGRTPWTLAETRRRVRKSMRDSFPTLFGDAWQDAGEVFYQRYAEIHARNLIPSPGAAAMLDAVAAAGVYLGVVSNKKGEFLRVEARQLGWDRYFGALVGALDAERDKPAPEPVRLALKGSGVAPGPEVWIAGDADIDLECAHNAGCTAILIRAAALGPGEFDAHPPACHFDGCDALSKFVRNL
jgi:phosphoglycolate phosphatase